MPKEDGRDYEDVHIQGWPNIEDHTVRRYAGANAKAGESQELICKRQGHDWETYTVSTGHWSNDVEQAGYCLRCGEDTHGEYHN